MKSQHQLLFAAFIGPLLAGNAAPALSTTLSIEFDISISSEFEYQTRSNVPFAFNGPVVLQMDMGGLKATDYGTTTITMLAVEAPTSLPH